jgi:hypothetical protein
VTGADPNLADAHTRMASRKGRKAVIPGVGTLPASEVRQLPVTQRVRGE